MSTSKWNDKMSSLQQIIMKPILYNDLSVTPLDALPANHDGNWIVGFHKHPWFEFNYVSEGGFYTTIDEQEFFVDTDNFILIPPGTIHSHRNFNNQENDGFCIRWQFEIYKMAVEDNAFTPVAASILNRLAIKRPSSFKIDLHRIFDNRENKSPDSLQIELLSLILAINDMFSGITRSSMIEKQRDDIVARQALLYLSEYYTNDLDVKDIANSMHISYRQLARVFKQVTGFTVIEKLNDIRINKAKALLKETDKAIQEIAFEVGYSNGYYFSKVFNDYAHASPSVFRSRSKK